MKRVISVLVALMLCLTLVPSAFAVESVSASEVFEDVQSDAWYIESLDKALSLGVVNGRAESSFVPDAVVSRAEFVTMLGRAFAGDYQCDTFVYEGTDIPMWSATYVNWVLEKGYLDIWLASDYVGETSFTIEQLACALDTYIVNSGAEILDYSPVLEYNDADSVSDFYKPYVDRALWYGLITVDEDGNINPQKLVTRVDSVVAVVRLYELLEYVFEPGVARSGEVTYDALIHGDYSLIKSHAVDDLDAVDNNIRYMLQNGLHELQLEFDDSVVDISVADQEYYDVYHDMIQHYPEFGLHYLKTHSTSDGIELQFTGYPYDYEELRGHQTTAFQAAVKVQNELYNCGLLDDSMTQKEKARVYFDWIVNHCEYDWTSFYGRSSLPFAWLAYGPIVRGWATCGGYTAAYNMFLRLEGIECSTESTPKHVWTIAWLDGVKYYIDATWSDMCDTDADPYFAMPDSTMVCDYGM